MSAVGAVYDRTFFVDSTKYARSQTAPSMWLSLVNPEFLICVFFFRFLRSPNSPNLGETYSIIDSGWWSGGGQCWRATRQGI